MPPIPQYVIICIRNKQVRERLRAGIDLIILGTAGESRHFVDEIFNPRRDLFRRDKNIPATKERGDRLKRALFVSLGCCAHRHNTGHFILQHRDNGAPIGCVLNQLLTGARPQRIVTTLEHPIERFVYIPSASFLVDEVRIRGLRFRLKPQLPHCVA